MQFTGRLLQVLPAQTGQGKNGEWRKQDIVLETDGQYPKKVCVSVWGDKMSHLSLSPGEMLTVDFDIESREYNGKWYTDVKAWKVASSTGSASDAPANSNFPTKSNFNNTASNFPSNPPAEDSFEDDLPF
ncbi:MAG: DUF3127 domain-containing protein [Saprospiraceae bacterium]